MAPPYSNEVIDLDPQAYFVSLGTMADELEGTIYQVLGEKLPWRMFFWIERDYGYTLSMLDRDCLLRR